MRPNPYTRFMHPFAAGWLDVDPSDLDGFHRLIWELRFRTYAGNSKLPHKWFQRACKRAGLSSMEMRRKLEDMDILVGVGRYTQINLPPVHWKTYNGWLAEGWQVKAGETSIARYTPEGRESQALFHGGQVIRRTVTGREQ
ncbi:hypothetical protein pD_gene0041 [Vibrio phage 033B]|nr:hypothetical protein pD_gene0041 [Vibrio phage 033B]